MKPVAGVTVFAGLFAASLSFLAAQTHDSKPLQLNVMLYDTPERAIAYSVALDGGAAEDEAKDALGRSVGKEVCDKFMGFATVEQVRTEQKNGVSYKITALKFDGVKDMKWMA
jgi:hypothetical protein